MDVRTRRELSKVCRAPHVCCAATYAQTSVHGHLLSYSVCDLDRQARTRARREYMEEAECARRGADKEVIRKHLVWLQEQRDAVRCALMPCRSRLLRPYAVPLTPTMMMQWA